VLYDINYRKRRVTNKEEMETR